MRKNVFLHMPVSYVKTKHKPTPKAISPERLMPKALSDRGGKGLNKVSAPKIQSDERAVALRRIIKMSAIVAATTCEMHQQRLTAQCRRSGVWRKCPKHSFFYRYVFFLRFTC